MTQQFAPQFAPQAAGFAPQAGVPAQAAPQAVAQTHGAVAGAGAVPHSAPVTAEVQQVALPQGFDLMQFAIHKEKAESSNAKTPVWELPIEDLRERVTFRDVQAPSNRNPAEYHLRPFLSPKSLALEAVLGTDAQGNPVNTIIVPTEYSEAAKEDFMNRLVRPGYFDNLLLATAEELRLAKLERDAAPKKAPVDTAAADAAMADLEAMQGAGVPAGAPAGAVVGQAPAAAPAFAAPQNSVVPGQEYPAQAAGMPAMPAGAPAGYAPQAAPQAAPQGIPAGVPAGMPNVPHFG